MAKKHTEMTLSPEAAAAAGIAGAAVAKTLGKAAETKSKDKDEDMDDADDDAPPATARQRGRKQDKSSPPSLDYDDGRADREAKEKAEREAKEKADREAKEKAEREAKAERDRLERERDRLERERLDHIDRERRSRARSMDYDDEVDDDFYGRERHDRTSRGWPGGGAGTIRPRTQVQVRDLSRGNKGKDDEEKAKLDELISSLPESERTSFCFAFRKMTPGVGKGAGGGLGLNCGIWYPIGDDWQISIKTKLAQKYGTGFYEGTIRGQDGGKVDAKDKWTFFISEEEAEECGWRSDHGDDASDPALPSKQGAASPLPVQGVTQQAGQVTSAPEVEDDFDPEKEERRAKWIEKRIKVVEAEKRLKEAMGEDEGAKKKKGGYEEEVAKILDAERRAARAEREALEARLLAEREAEKSRLQAEIAAREAKAEADRRELLAAIEREKDQHKRTTDTLQDRLERLARDIDEARKAPPPPPPPDALEIAEKVKSLVPDPVEQIKSFREFLPAPAEKSDFAGTITALGTVLQPLINAAITKLNAPPPPPPPQPDLVQIAETVAKLVHRPEPKHPDLFEVLERAKALMPPQPKPIDPVDLAMKVKELMPAPVDPFAALERAKNFLSPPGKQPNKQDVLLEMQQMVEFANSLKAMAGGGVDDDDDEASTAAQPAGITGVLEQIEALKKLGVPIEIGGGKGDTGSADKIMAGIEKALYAAGEAARRAGVFGGNKAEVDPALQAEIQRQKLMRQRAAVRQRQALTARQQRQQIGMQRQPARGMPPAPRTHAPSAEAEYVPKPMPGPAPAPHRTAPMPQPPQPPRQAVQGRPQPAVPRPPQVPQPPAPQARQQPQAAQPPAPQPPKGPAATQAAAQAPAQQASGGTPTSKDWGELCHYVNAAIEKLEDPSEAALHMLEHWPTATMMIADAPDVSLVELGLTSLSGNPDVGPFASVISELASRIRNDPGRSWAEHLLKALKN